MDKIQDELLEEAAKALIVQKEQSNQTEKQLVNISQGIEKLQEVNDSNLSKLDSLLTYAEEILCDNNLSLEDCTAEEEAEGRELIKLTKEEREELDIPILDTIETIIYDKNLSWDNYMDKVFKYADNYSINLSDKSLNKLLSGVEKAEFAAIVRQDYKMKNSKCDKYDYLIGALCGVFTGVIDIFFVNLPDESKLGKWSNKQTDEFIINIAKIRGWKSKDNQKDKAFNAIQFLEEKYKVNYDQATGKSVDYLLDMSASNHHIKSLGHAPDIIGLIFSLVDQFTSTSHFLDNGKLIIFDTNQSQLYGNDFISKLFCGFSNWLGHLISDVAGSSSSRRKNKDCYGSGIPMPFFELLQLCNKGKFKVYSGNDKHNESQELSLADLSVKIFEKHYDLRFGFAQGIPVIINELMIRLLWTIKSRFYNKKKWLDCMSFKSQPELRRTLLTGYGVLCIVDGLDASFRSQGQILLFCLRLNLVAWERLSFLGLLELRTLYKENSLDIYSIELDLKEEWERLYESSVNMSF